MSSCSGRVSQTWESIWPIITERFLKKRNMLFKKSSALQVGIEGTLRNRENGKVFQKFMNEASWSEQAEASTNETNGRNGSSRWIKDIRQIGDIDAPQSQGNPGHRWIRQIKSHR
jgi:hypothetical protein